MKLKLKKGDEAQVVTGSEKGKKAQVLQINRHLLKVRLQGVKIQTHFDKKKGIQKKEGWIDYSNVKLVRAAAKKPKKTSPPVKDNNAASEKQV